MLAELAPRSVESARLTLWGVLAVWAVGTIAFWWIWRSRR